MTEAQLDCVFCLPSSLIVWRGNHVQALVDPAPIIDGHFLIYTKKHYPSAADVPPEVAAELDEVCSNLTGRYREQFDAYTMFEHGRTGHCVYLGPEERMCNHLHIHLMPLRHDLAGDVELSQRIRWQTWSDVAELASDLEGYLVVDTAVAGKYFFPATRPLPPHYLRSLCARAVIHPERADWEAYVEMPESAAAVERTWALVQATVGQATDLSERRR